MSPVVIACIFACNWSGANRKLRVFLGNGVVAQLVERLVRKENIVPADAPGQPAAKPDCDECKANCGEDKVK